MEIIKNTGFNIQGICEVKFAFINDLYSISIPDDNYRVTLNFKPNRELSTLYFTRTSDKTKIVEKNDESGKYYEALVELTHPHLDPSKSLTFNSIKNMGLIFVLIDKHGNQMLIGSLESPAKLTYKLSNSANAKNARTVSIDAFHDMEPFYVLESITASGRAFSEGFSGGFS